MSLRPIFQSASVALLVLAAGLATPGIARADLPVAQDPLYLERAFPPLNMLVVGKDHKLYYEAYNDASDLDGDGAIDIGYKPDDIEYFGYFNSNVCYTFTGDLSTGYFQPAAAAGGSNGKQCSGQWSGDFLNYLTTGRLDALRKVLYGGWRATDTDAQTILQGAFFPQDAHSWGKEYASITRDGYDIASYTPLSAPDAGRYHLFAVTTLSDNSPPRFRVQTNSPFRVWNWLSIEGPVAGTRCFNDNRINPRVQCTSSNIQAFTQGVETFFSYPTLTYTTWRRNNTRALSTNLTGLNTAFTNDAVNARRCNTSGGNTVINQTNNPYKNQNGCPNNDNEFLAQYSGTFVPAVTGTWRVEVRGGGSAHLSVMEGATSVLSLGRYNQTGNGNVEADVALVAGTTYTINYRMETRSNGNRDQRVRWRRPAVAGATAITDYLVRIEACGSNAALHEDNCKEYPDGNFKPTGILHDYGETDRMYFGLITGSQANNLQGGVLRRNISSFADEIDEDTGVFLAGVNGIARSLNRLRMIGGGYAGGTTDNSGNDSNWAWANGTGNCPSIGNRAINNGECRMWGNPIGEMMFEALRYYAGAEDPTEAFATGGASQGQTEDTTLGLPTPGWRDPYLPTADGGLGFATCAKPVMTVVSDINPSYDSNVPGGWDEPTYDLPDTIDDFSLSTVGAAIWNAEFGAGARNVFIGEAASTDGAPTVKSASSFGSIRGLSPEEPTKEGSYAASAVAFYGWTKDGDLNPNSSEKLRTYAVALASPLPRIEFPVGGQIVTFVPFAKTAGGTFGDGTRKPTNTIVDFYVEEFVNIPGQDADVAVNGGRPQAIFRINYEDVEQGNDHDMDAIVRYRFTANADNTVTVELVSEYAAGSAIQHMGYVASGTTADGVYLEVRDTDTAPEASPAYLLNTPPGRAPGYCNADPAPNDCDQLPLYATRTFTPSNSAADAIQLRDPLWYAAKYGGFDDENRNGLPEADEWDEDGDGVPDKYFLVTNALTLKEQLARAFSEIELDSRPAGGVAASGLRVQSGFTAFVPEYDANDWTGDLKAYEVFQGNTLRWSANEELPEPSARNIWVSVPDAAGDLELKTFTSGNLGGNADEAALALGFASEADIASTYSNADIDDAVDFLRGDQSKEIEDGVPTATRVFRTRSRVIGDILGSQPVITDRGSFGYSAFTNAQIAGAEEYGEFVIETKLTRPQAVFLGSNDGMIHGFEAETGEELFAVIPNSVLANTHELLEPAYGHRYFVDGSPELGDAYLNGRWESVLLTGMGAGGRSVVALTVTDTVSSGFDASNFLWEFVDPDLGLTLTRPRIMLMQNGKWYAVFGNGLNSDSDDAYLFLVNLEDADESYKVRAAEGDDSTLASHNGLGSPTGIDSMAEVGGTLATGSDGRVDRIYAADYRGRVYRFDFGANESQWESATPQLIFEAEDADGDMQHITGSVGVSVGTTDTEYVVHFGTGRYLLEGDNRADSANPQVQTFYSVLDRDDGVTATRADLIEQTIDAEDTTTGIRTVSRNLVPLDEGARGWFIDLKLAADTNGTGEQFIGEPRVELGRAIFVTFEPEGTECEPGGVNRLYALDSLTGAANLTLGAPDCTANDSCGGIALNSASQSAPPAVSPPIVVDPGQPGGGCPADDPTCDPCNGDPDCDPSDPPACPPGGIAGVTPGCPAVDPDATPNDCASNVGVLLANEGGGASVRTFLELSCGRQQWRQIQ